LTPQAQKIFPLKFFVKKQSILSLIAIIADILAVDLTGRFKRQ
jgi:hypothetical protein